ncbi:hypothetical protein DW858_10040 [Lachnospira eligens]|uniref:Uncharacterized protein n=1 Tax=Lachnospira eligens TaxID=39485 RepID=A0A413YTQ7_9FIRM|nr:hypothetical protein DW858_10040 [Lachnospira eligens]
MVSRGAPRQRQNEFQEYELLAQSEAMSEATESLQPCLHGLGTLYGFTMSTATTTERISGV